MAGGRQVEVTRVQSSLSQALGTDHDRSEDVAGMVHLQVQCSSTQIVSPSVT